ncbi:MFS transporter [Actinoallomurus purpureus]|uniref:MFS transporter n=1 Tax=Actinoallomurus purpureus TaxID=478114 RepID=UPI0027E294D1|nr:MFS transporter [Actinoallomurus purpureus]
MTRAASLWRHRDFMLLWGGQTINMTGTQVSQLAVPLVALSVLHASAFQVSLLSAMGFVPYVLAGLPAGALVDRFRRRPLMVWCSLSQGLVLGSVPVAIVCGDLTLWQLSVVAFIVASLAALFDPAYQSYLPSLLPARQLVDGNGKLGASYAFATVVGQSTAGWLVAALGAAGTIGVDAVSSLMSAASLKLIAAREPSPERHGTRMRAEIGEGLRYVFHDRLMRPVVLANTMVSAGIGASWSLWVLYVVRDLHWPMVVAGLCQGVAAVGGVLGGLCTEPLARRLGLPLLMLVTTPMYVLDLVPTVLVGPGLTGQVVVTVGYTVALAGEFAYVNANLSYRQLICPPDLLGRMNATTRWLSWGIRPLFTLIFGLIATWIGVRAALSLAAGLFAFPFAILVASPLRGRTRERR